VIKNPDRLTALGQVGAENMILHLDITSMNETNIMVFGLKARRDLFCSVVIAEAGKIQNFKDSYNKLQATNNYWRL